MKILLFIALFWMGIYFIPDIWITGFVKGYIHISGDGEDAMDSFEMHVIVIKMLLCALCAYFLLTLIYGFRHRPTK